METKDRLKIFLLHLNIGQNAFEKKVGISNGYINNFKGSLGSKITSKIAQEYPELNLEWLLTGEGEMLKTGNTQTVGDISHSTVGDIVAGSKKVKYVEKSVINHDEGKDMVIEKQEREVIKMFDALMSQLDKFHEITTGRDEYVKRQDDYIKNQDEYLSRVIQNSYMRNERNMERIDANMERFDKLIEQQNVLIESSNVNQRKTQEQMDRILTMLEKKL